jgi:glutamate-1-semialdehyde 2,1-aminomutase
MERRRDELLERAAILPELRRRADHHPLALKAQGGRIYDVDNVGYIDYVGAGGAAIVGYANQFVLDAVKKVLSTGVPDGMHGPQEVDLAETLGHFLPWVGSWWLCRNPDEALAATLRWIAQQTERDQFLCLDGGGRLFTGAAATGTRGEWDGLSFRDVPGWAVGSIEEALDAGALRVAALILDPLMSRAGVIPPPEGVLRRVADACRRNGVLLVLDERVSGFRIRRGGAVEFFGVVPDVAVYGGALGGGFPIGAVAFSSAIDPPVLKGGLSVPAPHPVSLAAAEAVLSILKNDTIYERLEERSQQLAQGLAALAERFGRPLTVNRLGSVFSIYMVAGEVTDRPAAERADAEAYRRFVRGLLAEGVLFPQQPRHNAFVSNAHGAKDVDETLTACERVLQRLQQEDAQSRDE